MVLCQFAPDALDSVVHRFRGLVYLGCNFGIGQTVQIQPKYACFETGQLALQRPHPLLKRLPAEPDGLWVFLELIRRAVSIMVAVPAEMVRLKVPVGDLRDAVEVRVRLEER